MQTQTTLERFIEQLARFDLLAEFFRWILLRRQGWIYQQGYRRGLAGGKDEPEAWEVAQFNGSTVRGLAYWFRGYRHGRRRRQRLLRRKASLPADWAKWAQPIATDEQWVQAGRRLGQPEPSTPIPRDQWERIKRKYLG